MRAAIKQDNEIIAAGGFWCHACLVGKPVGKQSLDPRYCQGCYESIKGNKFGILPSPGDMQSDYWTKDGAFFIHSGQKYGISASGKTIYCGLVEVKESGRASAEALSKGQEVVAKLPEGELVGVEDVQAENGGSFETSKHLGGRPRKEGKVHRVTTWRRGKETQGVLLV